jgi:hypothetical protein
MAIKSELKWCCKLGWSGDATIGIEDFRKGIEKEYEEQVRDDLEHENAR